MTPSWPEIFIRLIRQHDGRKIWMRGDRAPRPELLASNDNALVLHAANNHALEM